MPCTIRNSASHSRTQATLESERRFYTHAKQLVQIHASRPRIVPHVLRPGESSLLTMPVACARPDFGAQLSTSRHFQRHVPKTAIHRKPVNAAAVTAVAGLLVGYVVLVVLLIATSSRPALAHQSTETSFGRPLGPSYPAIAYKHVSGVSSMQPHGDDDDAIVKAATQVPSTAFKAFAAARREKAMNLLNQARHSDTETLAYRETLCELAGSYADTPAGAEALTLLTELKAAGREKAPEVKQAEEKARYGLGLMED